VIGTWVATPNPDIVEMLGHAGFDFAVLDLEHGSFGLDALPGLFRAADVAQLAALVRVPADARHLVGNVIDAGAAGIVVPAIADAATGAEMIALTRYPPAGRRGAHNSTRSLAYSSRPFNDAVSADEQQRPLMILQIEEPLPAEDVDSIAALDGLDVLFVGAYDLSLRLGLPGQFDHPDVRAAVDLIVATGIRHRRAIGLWSASAAAVPDVLARGFRFLTIANSETIFFNAARAIATAAKAAAGEAS